MRRVLALVVLALLLVNATALGSEGKVVPLSPERFLSESTPEAKSAFWSCPGAKAEALSAFRRIQSLAQIAFTDSWTRLESPLNDVVVKSKLAVAPATAKALQGNLVGAQEEAKKVADVIVTTAQSLVRSSSAAALSVFSSNANHIRRKVEHFLMHACDNQQQIDPLKLKIEQQSAIQSFTLGITDDIRSHVSAVEDQLEDKTLLIAQKHANELMSPFQDGPLAKQANKIMEARKDACTLFNCKNGGSCQNGKCTCKPGFRGTLCHIADDLRCNNVQCKNGGFCLEGSCRCGWGYSGASCQIEPPQNWVTDCAGVTCGKHGMCSRGQCLCHYGWSGAKCYTPPNHCDGLTCLNNARCDRRKGECSCARGFSGELCQTPPDLCKYPTVKVCLNEGVCDSGVCQCKEGWSGENCETKVDMCKIRKCFNGGFCRLGICICPSSHTGLQCEVKIDPCANIQCLNNGECYGEGPAAKCVCPEGFAGSRCERGVQIPQQTMSSFMHAINKHTKSTMTDFQSVGDEMNSIGELISSLARRADAQLHLTPSSSSSSSPQYTVNHNIEIPADATAEVKTDAAVAATTDTTTTPSTTTPSTTATTTTPAATAVENKSNQSLAPGALQGAFVAFKTHRRYGRK